MGTGRKRPWQQRLRAEQLKRQQGICPICSFPLSDTHAVLDRFDRIGDFTPANVRALHADCEALVRRRRAAGYASIATRQAAE
jgi:hypothetical protein